jgi:hypothetical protein
MVQVSTKSSNDSAPDNMVRKITVGESVLIESERMGWLSEHLVVVRISPGLRVSLASDSGSMQLPRVKSVSVYDIFSGDSETEFRDSSSLTVIPLSASSSGSDEEARVEGWL